jgi:hypothetical protein
MNLQHSQALDRARDLVWSNIVRDTNGLRNYLSIERYLTTKEKMAIYDEVADLMTAIHQREHTNLTRWFDPAGTVVYGVEIVGRGPWSCSRNFGALLSVADEVEAELAANRVCDIGH